MRPARHRRAPEILPKCARACSSALENAGAALVAAPAGAPALTAWGHVPPQIASAAASLLPRFTHLLPLFSKFLNPQVVPPSDTPNMSFLFHFFNISKMSLSSPFGLAVISFTLFLVLHQFLFCNSRCLPQASMKSYNRPTQPHWQTTTRFCCTWQHRSNHPKNMHRKWIHRATI